MTNRYVLVTCASCRQERYHEGRGLCLRCYQTRRKHGTLDAFRRNNQPAADLVEDWQFLARQGYTRALAAERMGITKKRLEKAIERTQKRMLEAS